MKSKPLILIYARRPSTIKVHLSGAGFDVLATASPANATAALASERRVVVAVIDWDLPNGGARRWLDARRRSMLISTVPIIALTSNLSTVSATAQKAVFALVEKRRANTLPRHVCLLLQDLEHKRKTAAAVVEGMASKFNMNRRKNGKQPLDDAAKERMAMTVAGLPTDAGPKILAEVILRLAIMAQGGDL